MKIIIVLCLLSVAIAAPDRSQAKSAKQSEAQGTDIEPMVPEVEDAPYPPSGWKPQGIKLELKPNDEFKPTLTVKFDISKNELSNDNAETTTESAESETTTFSEETTTENENDSTTTEMPQIEETTNKPVESPSKEAEDEKEKLEQLDEEKEEKAMMEEKMPESYYILIPDGRLQRVLYTVISDPERQQFSSRFQTASVNSPLVYYTPQYFTIY